MDERVSQLDELTLTSRKLASEYERTLGELEESLAERTVLEMQLTTAGTLSRNKSERTSHLEDLLETVEAEKQSLEDEVNSLQKRNNEQERRLAQIGNGKITFPV